MNFFVLGIRFKRRRGKQSEFLKWSERVVFLNRFNKGIRLSHNKYLSLEDSYKNSLTVAPVGSGKSTGVVIPNVLDLKNSAIVTDMGSEIYNLTSGYLEKQGFNIQVLNLQDPSNSICFNPLLSVKNSPERILELSENIVAMQGERTKGEDRFWSTTASMLINCILLALARFGKDQFLHLHQAYQILIKIKDPLVQKFLATRLPKEQWDELHGILTADQRLLSNVLAVSRSILKFAGDPTTSKIMSGGRSDFSIDDLRNSKTILYIICPISRFNFFKPVISLFYSELFNQLLEREGTNGQPIHFFLDEFGNLEFPNFGVIIATLRKRYCSLNLFIQDEAQLYSKYGQNDAETIKANCLTRLILSGLSYKTVKEASEMLGMVHGENGSEPLISSEQIRTMDKEEMLCIFGNLPAVKLQLKPYFRSMKYKRRTTIPPCELKYNSGENQGELIDFDMWKKVLERKEKALAKSENKGIQKEKSKKTKKSSKKKNIKNNP